MPFDPATFYCVAIDLQRRAGPDSAELRTAITRAYYAGLIVARDARARIERQHGRSTHDDVIDAYQATGDARDAAVASWLRGLRKKRNDADYHPEKALQMRDLLTEMSMSRQLLQHLGRMPKCLPTHAIR